MGTGLLDIIACGCCCHPEDHTSTSKDAHEGAAIRIDKVIDDEREGYCIKSCARLVNDDQLCWPGLDTVCWVYNSGSAQCIVEHSRAFCSRLTGSPLRASSRCGSVATSRSLNPAITDMPAVVLCESTPH